MPEGQGYVPLAGIVDSDTRRLTIPARQVYQFVKVEILIRNIKGTGQIFII